MKRLLTFFFGTLAVTLLWFASFCEAKAQTHTWLTGAAEYNNPTIKVQEFGNSIKIYIDVPNAPNKYATFIAKSFFPGFKIVQATTTMDPKLSQEYKDLLVKFTNANQMLAQEITLVNTYQMENDKLNAERQVLISELRKYKNELLKYRPMMILVPRDTAK